MFQVQNPKISNVTCVIHVDGVGHVDLVTDTDGVASFDQLAPACLVVERAGFRWVAVPPGYALADGVLVILERSEPSAPATAPVEAPERADKLAKKPKPAKAPAPAAAEQNGRTH